MLVEYAGRDFDDLPERAAGDRGFWGARVEDDGFHWLGRNKRATRLTYPTNAAGLHVTLGDGAVWIGLTGRVPGESEKGLAGGGIR